MSIIIDADSLDERNPVNATGALRPEWDRYGFVSTREVLNVFGRSGWEPVSTTAIQARNPERQAYQKHMVRLENPTLGLLDEGAPEHLASRPQIILINSHDGSSSLQLKWGLIRFACLNGLISGEGIQGVRITHNMQILDRLPVAIDEMLAGLPKFVEQVVAMQRKQLSQSAVQKMVKTVYDARLEGIKNLKEVDYTLPLLRPADDHLDAFTVFNRVQEVVMRGGIQYRYTREEPMGDRAVQQVVPGKTRPLNSVASQLKLNQLAYDTAMELV